MSGSAQRLPFALATCMPSICRAACATAPETRVGFPAPSCSAFNFALATVPTVSDDVSPHWISDIGHLRRPPTGYHAAENRLEHAAFLTAKDRLQLSVLLVSGTRIQVEPSRAV